MSNSRKRPLGGDPYNDHYTFKHFNDDLGKPIMKMLIPSFVASKLIGKGGTTISELQSKYNLSIQITPHRFYYPGTNDRIMGISGDMENMLEFGSYLMTDDFFPYKDTAMTEFKLIISNAAAGMVIGKAGAVIKAIISESNGAKVFVENKDQSVTGERIVTLSGDCAQRTAAFKQIMKTIAEAPHKMSSTNMTYHASDGAVSSSVDNHGNYQVMDYRETCDNSSAPYAAYGMDSVSSNYQQQSPHKAKFYAELEVPDKLVGFVLGKSGKTITEISRNSGARLEFSKNEDSVDGTNNRLLTISGGMYQVQNAYMLVDERLAYANMQYHHW